MNAPMPRGAVDDPSWNSDQLSEEDKERKAEIDVVLDPAESMKNRRDTKNLTIGEIKSRDEDNLRLVLNTAREHVFDHPLKAVGFVRDCIGKAMTKLGITELANSGSSEMFMKDSYSGALAHVTGNLYTPGRSKESENLVVKQAIENDVRVEVRRPEMYPESERWKAGFYVYHHGEIAFFISNPMKDNKSVGGSGFIIIPSAYAQRWFVKTNVPSI